MKTIKITTFLLFLVLVTSCEKEVDKPNTSIGKIEYITHNSCIISVSYNFNDFNAVNTTKGICFGINPEPTIEDTILSTSRKINNSDNNQNYFMVSLKPNTTYFVRSFIKPDDNDAISYSSSVEFKTNNIEYFTDNRDNKKYPIVKIGDDYWLAENLAYKVEGNSWYYDNDSAYKQYGMLYSYQGALNAVPDGWHIPTDEEWATLEKSIFLEDSLLSIVVEKGMYEAAKIKQIGSDFWRNAIGTNETGFSALPSGFFVPENPEFGLNEQFDGLFTYSIFLSNTEYDEENIWVRQLIDSDNKIERLTRSKEWGFSVRCVRD